MSTFSQIKSGLDEIAGKNKTYRDYVDRSRKQLEEAASRLAAMPADYAGLVQQVETMAAANAGNEAFAVALAEKNELVRDFQALRAYVNNLLTAFNNVVE